MKTRHTRAKGARRFQALLAIVGIVAGGLSQSRLSLAQSTEAQDGTQVVAECVALHARAQELRAVGELLESRQSLERCAVEACPELVQTDCAAWLADVETVLSSLVVSATVEGRTDAKLQISVDGAVRPAGGAGEPLVLEPGLHRIEVRHPDYPSRMETLTLEAGDERVFAIDLLPRAPGSEGLLWKSLAGVGIVGLAGFAALGLNHRRLEARLASSCSPNCSPERVDRVRLQGMLANVSLGIGVTSLAGSAAVYWLKSTSKAAQDSDMALSVVPVPGGAFGNVTWSAY